MKLDNKVPHRALALAVAFALTGAAQLQAQDTSAQSGVGTLEEVIITGTKRNEASQDVPIAISAISAADL